MSGHEGDPESTASDRSSQDPWAEAIFAIYLLMLPEPLPIAHGSTWTRRIDEREPLLHVDHEDDVWHPIVRPSEPAGDDVPKRPTMGQLSLVPSAGLVVPGENQQVIAVR